jgi:hypothetical protein
MESIDYPFQHPAAEEVRELVLKLEFNSMGEFRKLPRRERYLWEVVTFEIEVMNGGIDQYFGNPSGDAAAECLLALETIGAKQSHRLLKTACDLFPAGSPSANEEERREQLRRIRGNTHLDDVMDQDLQIELELYQLLLDYYKRADPQAK